MSAPRTCFICHEEYDDETDQYHLDACRDSVKP